MVMALGVLAVGPPGPADPRTWQDSVEHGPIETIGSKAQEAQEHPTCYTRKIELGFHM